MEKICIEAKEEVLLTEDLREKLKSVKEKLELDIIKKTHYEDALKKSVDYFNGDEFSAKVFIDKYALRDEDGFLIEDTPEAMFDRLSFEIAKVEKNKFKKPLSFEEIKSYIGGFKRLIPQGSPMFGIGNKEQYVSTSNCFVINSPEDSYGGILKTDEEIVQISKRRGGVGLDISKLRPNGSKTTNAARTSTGIISFLERYSNSIREVGQNGRRGALLVSLSVHHPDIVSFITSKQDLTKITGANISVRLSDEFLKAVEEKKEYEQRWPVDSKTPTISKMVSAEEVWNKIIELAWKTAEPGLLFWDTILKESPANCYKSFGFNDLTTNPCGEIVLCADDSCRLLCLNVYSYVKNPFTKEAYFDYEYFKSDVKIAQRIQDDIIDLEIEALQRIINKIKKDPEIDEIKEREIQLWKRILEKAKKGRRTGTGITALGDALAAIGLKYGSKESIEEIDKIYKILKLGCYESSVEMAKELGCFGIWNKDLEKDNPFLNRIKDEDEKLYKDMQKYGRRNISCLTTPPAGSISTLTQTTSGIEPCFQISYKRRKKINENDEGIKVDFIDKNGDKWQEFDIYHPKVKVWSEVTGEKDISKSPWYGCCAEEINWENRVKIQATANKHVDHSISSTINLPEDVSIKEVSKIYTAAWKEGVKGITVYRKGCRTGVLVDNTKEEGKTIKKTVAPKRPPILPCDIYHATSKGEQYFVLVGIMGEDPYEVFAGKNGNISKIIKKGMIKKLKRGKYSLIEENGDVLQEDISHHIDEDQEAITRLISSSLRHGCDVSFIVHQLEKVKGDLLSFAKALSRCLKKYVPDNSKIHGEVCKECGADLIRVEGCVQCKSCGWSRC